MAKDVVPYFNFYPIDFMHGVRGLTAQEVGVYTMILCRIYEESGPVDLRYEVLAAYCGMRVKTLTAVIKRLVELGKLQVEDGAITNARAIAEISKRANSLKNKSKAGKASAEIRQGKQRDSATGVEHTFNHTNTDTDITTEGKPSVVSAPDEKPPAAKSKRGTRIPDDWTPSMEDRQYAVSKGVPAGMVDEAAEEFRNYWKSAAGAKGVKLDWRATWQNRCILIGRQIAEREARNSRFPPKPPDKPRNRGGFATILQENMDELLRDFHDEQPPHHADDYRRSEPEIIPPDSSDTRGFSVGEQDLFRDENRADGLSNVFDFRQARAYG